MDAHHLDSEARRVAVVEDDEMLFIILKYNLEAAGFRVLHVANGNDALSRIREWTPDLVVLDWLLPNLNGIEILRQLRRDGATSALPVLMLSAKAEPCDRSRASAVGADLFLTKPFSLTELMQGVQRLLHKAS